MSRTRGLHGHVVEQLGQRIAAGELAGGTQVVPADLCERYDASRPVVREALRALEAKGMLRPRPRTGTRVLPLGEWNLLDPDVIRWRAAGPQGGRQLDELSDLRAAVEIFAARGCARHASSEQVARLHDACDRMDRAGDDLAAFTAADVDFHALLLEASGNTVFGSFAGPFAAFLHAREDLHTLPDHIDREVLEDHRAIVVAIERHEADRAEHWARSVVERSRAEVVAAMRSRRAGSADPPGSPTDI